MRASSRTPHAAVFHDLQELGVDGEALEHADVRATRVAGGNRSDERSHRTKHDARGLAKHCDGFTAMNRNPEHEPVRPDVWNGVLLAEDMGALEMKKRLVVFVLAHERSSRRNLLLESLILSNIHGRS
jgi:hypothetical protein